MAFHRPDPSVRKPRGQAKPVRRKPQGDKPAAAKADPKPEIRKAESPRPEGRAPSPRKVAPAPRKPEPGPPVAAGPEAHERVARTLARAGVASRREVERMIEAGRVALNGQFLTSPAVNVGPRDILTVDGVPISEREPTRVFRYHKPNGLLTSHNDPKGRPTVFAALPKEIGRVISVGRLDLNSEGLLLLTNDGALARTLELPTNGWVRRYRARAYGKASQAKLDSLRHGVDIEGVAYGPIRAEMEKDAGGSNHWINVAITEGKNREVRRVLEFVGLKVNRLIRLSYGPFELGELEPGAVEELAPKIIRDLLSTVIAPENLPQGHGRSRFFRPDKPAKARAAGPKPDKAEARKARDKPEAPKTAYKAGWARPKIKPKPTTAKPPRRSGAKPRAGK
jgi:23S rRNA pseudouridine2605 synthase